MRKKKKMSSCTSCNHTTATFGIEDSETRKIKWYCYVCYMERTDKQRSNNDDKTKPNK